MNFEDHDDTLPLSVEVKIDVICDEFERAFQAAEVNPRIEDFLERLPEAQREFPLDNLLGVELQVLIAKGCEVDADSYVRRFSDYADVVESALRRVESGLSQDNPLMSTGNKLDETDDQRKPAYKLAGVPEESIPERIGRYDIRRVLGQGAFGRVYLARDPRLNRTVALKVPTQQLLDSGTSVEVFLDEAHSAARCNHPNLATVYDVRSDEGLPYIVQEYIDGYNLREWARRNLSTNDTVVRLLIEIAEAVGFAHQHGLLHRDLKPTNILIDRKGSAHVADFGLAVHESAQTFRQGEVCGTPHYMSPEQVRGETHRLDGRTDIWSLGVILYELLAGTRPFAADTRDELYDQIENAEPRPIRQRDPSIPQELERICLKCLEKRSRDRYKSTADLTDDLQHWLDRDNRQGSDITAAETENDAVNTHIIPKGLRSFDASDADFFLELLPGPRDREGLPESIRFWKARIETTDDSFRVGLIYGPSGCGKSSLVKAGLLPRLSPRVRIIYVEATPDDTEDRLMHELKKHISGITAEISLTDILRNLRERDEQKILIVLDQFEQWLHSHPHPENTSLVRALRHADGRHVQCVAMVRDEFWMAITVFMRQLEIPLVEDYNSRAVEPFHAKHARKVLSDLGRAYGALASERELTSNQEKFLDSAGEQLEEDGKIVCVRLALFAQMMQGKSWTMEELKKAGGAAGLGVQFLEETFSSSSAPPANRYHEKAIRGVLKALLPQTGTLIKGQMLSQCELREAAGYENQPDSFEELLRIMDAQVRLITPSDPTATGANIEDVSAQMRRKHLHYQLTHDYLVPSVREWLTRKQKETWRGRADLCLEERASQYRQSPDRRFLPTLKEYVLIQCGVTRKEQTAPQLAVMNAATRRFSAISGLLILAVVLLGGLAWQVNGRIQARQIVDKIYKAKPTELKDIIDNELPAYRRWAGPTLASVANNSNEAPERRLCASLATVPVDASQVGYLNERLTECSVDEFAVIRDSLEPHASTISSKHWRVLTESGQGENRRFYIGMALAKYAPNSKRWNKAHYDFLASQLVSANTDDQPKLRSYLDSISQRLLNPLKRRFRESASDSIRVSAANALVRFAGDDAEQMAELASIATPRQYAILFPQLSDQRQASRERLMSLTVEHPQHDFSDSNRIDLGRRRASSAISLVRLGERGSIFDVFRIQDDPESLTQFVHRHKDRGVMAIQLIECLEQAEDEYARFGLLLALGEFEIADAVADRRQPLISKLIDWYANDPSSAIHGASGWLLRHWGQSETAREVDETPVPYTPGREWFTLEIAVNADGPPETGNSSLEQTMFMTFVVFQPGDYVVGAPNGEKGRSPNEELHRVTITRPFAVLERELTCAEFMLFDGSYKERAFKERPESFTSGLAAIACDWYDSVRFCRWLTEQAGWAEADQPYPDPQSLDRDSFPRDPDKNARARPRNWPLRLDRRGFRLPTEAEWEIACRSGSQCAYGFGSDASLLGNYGWVAHNGGGRPHEPRLLRPNLRGLFDLHGNAWEWCHDWYDSYSDRESNIDPHGRETGPQTGIYRRVSRGGSFYINPAHRCRSASRTT